MVENHANDNEPEPSKNLSRLEAFRAKYPTPSKSTASGGWSGLPSSLLGHWMPTEEIVEGEKGSQRFYVHVLPPRFMLEDQEKIVQALGKYISADDFFIGAMSDDDPRWCVGIRAEAYESHFKDALEQAARTPTHGGKGA